MTKIYVAKPEQPIQPLIPLDQRGYSVSTDAQIALSKRIIEAPTSLGVVDRPQRGSYRTNAGSEFDLEIYVLDSASKRPLRSVLIKSGLLKGHTDRLGKLSLRLPTGFNSVSLEGVGYVEEGAYTPKRVEFKPINLDVDLDSNEIITIYIPEGSVVQGERHELANPNNPHNSQTIPLFIQDNWQVLALVGGAGVIAYYLGSRSKDS